MDVLPGASLVGLGAAAVGRKASALVFDSIAGEAASRIDGENFTNVGVVVLRCRGKLLRCWGSAPSRAGLSAAAMVKFSSMLVCGCYDVVARRSNVAVPDAAGGDAMPLRYTL
ncbi:MAG: hypothetical protein V4673_02645 [Pseudomonadota bacterium]